MTTLRLGACGALLLPAVLAACRSSSPKPSCTPGQVASCPCAGGGQGVQSCSAGGSGYGPCQCGGSSAGSSSGGSGSSGSSGGTSSGGGSSGSSGGVVGTASGPVGADGGVVTLGSGASAASVTVPAGAVNSAQTLTITQTNLPCPTGFTCYSPVFQFGPSGTTFQKPVTVSLPFTGNQQLATLFWSYPNATGYQRVGGLPSGTAVTGNVSHFSTGFIADGVNYSQAADTSCVQTVGLSGRYTGETPAQLDAGVGCVSNCADGGCQTGCPTAVYPMVASNGDGGSVGLGSAVALFFNVQDCQGRPVTNLDAGSFTVLENGAPLSVEAQTTVLPTNGVTVFAELVLDVSSHTDALRAQMFQGAENFVNQIQVTDHLPVAIGIETFAGEATIAEQLAPTLDTAAIQAKLQALTTFVDPDVNSTNLYGAVVQSFAHLDQVEASFEQRNYGGAFAVGFPLLFTDGLDTAGYDTQAQAVAAEQGDFKNQLLAVALQDSSDYNLAALAALTYGGQTLINSPNPTVAESREFPYLATYIAGEVSGAYLLGYCSPKRANVNNVTVEVANTTNQVAASLSFNASGFGPGCSAAAFGTACQGWQCGGLGCGACDDETSVCTGPAANQCESDCVPAQKCGGMTFTNPQGYQQTCSDTPESSSCNSTCVDLQTDSSNCGACGKACTISGEACSGGACACTTPGDTACGTACTDTRIDPANCGGCNAPCAPGDVCQAGVCTCVQSACGSGATCQAGGCLCGSGGQVCLASFGGTCSGSQCLSPWASWPMPNPASTGLPNPSSYNTATPGVVVDNVTGLMWQQPLGAPSGGSTWSAAASYCASLSLAGYTGWRLPTEIELYSLVDFTVAQGTAATIDATAFPNTPAAWFWSSSPLAGNPSYAWSVPFGYGSSSYYDVSYTYRVRCVR